MFASLLLPGGRTAHSRFKIPCDLDDTSICDVKRGSMVCELIESASLVIWDEALMTHRHAFEALDRTFRDLMSRRDEGARDLIFGGKFVLLGGDLRQILPVVEGGGRAQVVDAAVVNSPLWKQVTILTLNINMRLRCPDLTPEKLSEIASFSRWVLDIREGKIATVRSDSGGEGAWINLRRDLLLTPEGDKVSCIVDNVLYPELSIRYADPRYLSSRAILTPTNELVDSINSHMVSLVPGEEYLSCDRISRSQGTHGSYDLLYPVEFLNSINGNNFPQHRLVLKKGVPIMMLRNLDQSRG